jgi:16S rRNA processing protein RimM
MDSFTECPATVFEWTPWSLTRPADPASGRATLDRIETAPEIWKLRDKGYVVKLVGFPNRAGVESLVNCLIEVDQRHLPQLDNDEFYWRDLEGCHVEIASQQVLGVVKTVISTGANDVLVVRGDCDSIDRKERLIPFIEQTVLDVDVAARLIRVDWDPEF